MNTRPLEHFLALADALHFGRTAETVSISVSALSRNIRQLETTLGTELFLRDNRHVELTPAGRRFQDYARAALADWQAIRRELSDPDEPLQGRISLTCSVTASYGLLADRLGRFRIAHPGIDLRLHTGDPEDAIARVVDGKEELAIAARPERLPAGTLFKRLALSPLVFIAPAAPDFDVPQARRARAKPWSATPMIVARRGVARRRVDAWFRTLGATPRLHAEVAGNEAIVSMVALGFGVGVVPRLVLDNSPHAGQVRELPVEPELAAYEVGLVTLVRHLGNPLVAAFWELVVEVDAPVPRTHGR